MYVIVFGASLRILCRHKNASIHIYLSGTISLFVLGTLYVATTIWGLVREAIIEFQAVKTRDYTTFIKYLAYDSGKVAFL